MLTTKDWIDRAAAAPAERAELLARAEAVVRYADDHVAIATAWLDALRFDAARRSIGLALDLADGEHWPTVRAAEVLLRLGDREAAQAAVSRIEATLYSGERVRAYQWALLANAQLALFGNEAAALRAAKAGEAMARTTSDLADAAKGLAEHVDLDAARPLLERAEQRAFEANELRDLWGVAIVWQTTLGDHNRARSVLGRATVAAKDVGLLTSFAIAWRSLFDDDTQLRAALVRAEAIATTAAHWLDIAEAYFDGGRDNRITAWDADGVRRALEACIATAPPPELRGTIAAGYRDWLGITVDELGPAAVAPEGVVPAVRTFDGWDCSEPRALLDRLRERVTIEQLDEIAQADYGMDWLKHQRALLDIQTTGLLPMPLEWEPREVLELVRWSQGVDVDHVARGFACTILALDAGGPSSKQNGHINDVLAPLLESVWELGLDAELERTLVWLAEVVADEERVWPLVALALTHARHAADDARFEALVREIVAAETDANYADWGTTDWLFRTTNFDSYHALWRELAKQALADVTTPPLVELSKLLAVG